MKITTSFLLLIFLLSNALFSQSNIQQATSINSDGAAPVASAMLDIQATDKGMLVPRMTSAQRIAIVTPATGLLVFDTTTGGFWLYNGTVWANLSVQNNLADADGDTKIQVEESPDEDIVRFDLGGTERMVLRKNTNGTARLELFDVARNTSIGQESGVNIIPVVGISGNENTFLGYRSGSANTSGGYNTFLGSQSGMANTTGLLNTAVGALALSSVTTAFANTATGVLALGANTTGSSNTATGAAALAANTTGADNTATGRDAMVVNTTGTKNSAYGYQSLYSNTTGFANTTLGASSLYSNTTGSGNVACGREALYTNSTGSFNTAEGTSALFSNTTGSSNTAIGASALYTNAIGMGNTASGREALYANTGNHNSAYGWQALYTNTAGEGNTAIGRAALIFTTTGSNNAAIGFEALRLNLTGSNNTALGYKADVSTGDLSNSTAIGNGATCNISNKVRIGNTAVTLIEGQVAFTASDGRFKSEVRSDVPGINFIRQLKPVTYHFDYAALSTLLGEKSVDGEVLRQKQQRMEMGFIAQDLEAAMQASGWEVSNLLHAPENEHDYYSIAYGQLVVPLVQAVQEQQLEIGNLKMEIERLKKLETQLDKITTALQGMGVELK